VAKFTLAALSGQRNKTQKKRWCGKVEVKKKRAGRGKEAQSLYL
jgi:hypothetical protein